MTRNAKTVDVERLADISQEIKELVREAERIVRGTPEHDRARGYWIAQIRCALDDEHEYLGGSMHSMQDTIDALSGAEDDDPDYDDQGNLRAGADHRNDLNGEEDDDGDAVGRMMGANR